MIREDRLSWQGSWLNCQLGTIQFTPLKIMGYVKAEYICAGTDHMLSAWAEVTFRCDSLCKLVVLWIIFSQSHVVYVMICEMNLWMSDCVAKVWGPLIGNVFLTEFLIWEFDKWDVFFLWKGFLIDLKRWKWIYLLWGI